MKLLFRKFDSIKFKLQMLSKNYAVQKIKGKLGLFVESENCDGSGQKLDCEVLEKCRQDVQQVNEEKR